MLLLLLTDGCQREHAAVCCLVCSLLAAQAPPPLAAASAERARRAGGRALTRHCLVRCLTLVSPLPSPVSRRAGAGASDGACSARAGFALMAEPLAPPPETLVVPMYGGEEPGVAPPPSTEMELDAGAPAVKPTVLIGGKRVELRTLKHAMLAAGLGAVLCVVLYVSCPLQGVLTPRDPYLPRVCLPE